MSTFCRIWLGDVQGQTCMTQPPSRVMFVLAATCPHIMLSAHRTCSNASPYNQVDCIFKSICAMDADQNPNAPLHCTSGCRFIFPKQKAPAHAACLRHVDAASSTLLKRSCTCKCLTTLRAANGLGCKAFACLFCFRSLGKCPDIYYCRCHCLSCMPLHVADSPAVFSEFGAAGCLIAPQLCKLAFIVTNRICFVCLMQDTDLDSPEVAALAAQAADLLTRAHAAAVEDAANSHSNYIPGDLPLHMIDSLSPRRLPLCPVQ